jgi:hypothetical protein
VRLGRLPFWSAKMISPLKSTESAFHAMHRRMLPVLQARAADIKLNQQA